jgi:choice-of-anchor A domain-containing protein
LKFSATNFAPINCIYRSIITIITPVLAIILITTSCAWAGTPLGPNAQLFGILASNSITLAYSSTNSFVGQSPAPPETGGAAATIAGPTSLMTGDLITSAAIGLSIALGPQDAVARKCVTAGASISTAPGTACGSYDSSGTSPLLLTMSNAQSELPPFASFLAGLAPTIALGDVTLKKYQQLTLKLGPGTNVVAIGNLTTLGGNGIDLEAPKGAIVVVNVSGAISLGSGTQVFSISNSLNIHDVVWNLQAANPVFGDGVTIRGTLINVAENTTVTFNGRSAIDGALLTNGAIVAHDTMHVNFWPLTGAPDGGVVAHPSIARHPE